jgi:hypothetical protein
MLSVYATVIEIIVCQTSVRGPTPVRGNFLPVRKYLGPKTIYLSYKCWEKGNY